MYICLAFFKDVVTCCFTMQHLRIPEAVFCQGGELFDRLSEVFNLGERGARVCMKQVFASVAYCHSKGIAHRDLKPENYLLLDKDKPLEQTLLKLIDFGLAKKLPEEGFLKTRVGTAYYVAPEVLAQAYTEAADTWSAGVILYIMICGAPPFNAAQDSNILKLVKKGQYSMEGGVWPTVSSTCKSLIKACLEMDPQTRITAQDALSHEWPGAQCKPFFIITLACEPAFVRTTSLHFKPALPKRTQNRPQHSTNRDPETQIHNWQVEARFGFWGPLHVFLCSFQRFLASRKVRQRS